MCNEERNRFTRKQLRELFGVVRDLGDNLPDQGELFPDTYGPVIRMENGERVMSNARWGLPSSRKAILDAATKRADKLRAKGKPVDFDELLRMEPDLGTTNVRNTASSHWKRWLGPANRCLVPMSSFIEPAKLPDGRSAKAIFAINESQPLTAFAGIWVPQWTSVRKMKEGETTNDLYAFLTTEPNAEVKAVHPKAMPVILTQPDEWDAWLNWEWTRDGEPMASRLERPLPDGSLKVIGMEPYGRKVTA